MELILNVGHLQIDPVQVLVDKSEETLFDNLQLVWGVIQKSIKSVPLTTHSKFVIGRGNLFGNTAMLQLPVSLFHNDSFHGDIFGKTKWSPEVAN